MPYCPGCGYEYIKGTYICPDCDEELVDFLPEKETDLDKELKGGELKLLYSTPDMAFAGLMQGALESKEIPYLLKRGTGIHAQFGAMLPGSHSLFKIWVTEEYFNRALEIKKQIIGEE